MSEKAVMALICGGCTVALVAVLRWKNKDDGAAFLIALIGIISTATILGGCDS